MRNRLLKKDFSIHKDAVNAAATIASKSTEPHAPSLDEEKTLTPVSTGSINSMKSRNPASLKPAVARSSTIRSVRSFDGSESSPESKYSNFSSSMNSTTSALSNSNSDSNLHSHQTPVKTKTENDTHTTPSRWSTGAARVVEPTPEPDATMSEGVEGTDGHWDSTIGKAGLGKTGRVINKLVSDNEALKRDIKIERLKADEAKQAAKLVEDKLERMVSDYESRLLEANVTKTLLARKERQVETLQQTIELEKKKATDALSREKTWKDEVDKTKKDTTIQVEEATSYAQLMEGRYNAISSHWQDQGEEVKRAVSKMKSEIDQLNEERRADDDKIQTLRDLCDQQDGNIKQLRHEKEEIARMFEEYKKSQEQGLKGIKTNARLREDEQEALLEASRQTLNKLKWALNVKANVKGAQ
ncbi:chromosome segregation protein smc [Fusarium austroafricanum]|uniref:Chromosome segregation protein smc n=1 Tax=Fusarium austroafricanum TaxID=2364996 RepID=A0A8H4KQC5_9HYPO|nr:chromosome segregation protein smc [Fusarium austroafricanum]